MPRSITDAAILLDVLAGYDPSDPITAYAVGRVPDTYTDALVSTGLREARIGVIRDPMDSKTDTTSHDYQKVRAVIDQAIEDLEALGAVVIDPVSLPHFDSIQQTYVANIYETEGATNAYLAEHDEPPVNTLRDNLLSGVVTPWRARGLMGSIGKTTDDAEYLALLAARERLRQSVLTTMADQRLDALVYLSLIHI